MEQRLQKLPKLKSANINSSTFRSQTAKFNDSKYIRLYGNLVGTQPHPLGPPRPEKMKLGSTLNFRSHIVLLFVLSML